MSEAVAVRLPRRERVSEAVDKWLFMACFVVGALAIVVGKTWALPQWLVTVIPVAIIVAYFCVILFTPRFLLRDEAAGDSLYYLGFLFTLVSLAVALFQFNIDTDPGAVIVSNFGIALATTITGLMFRVLLAHLHQSPAEVERAARVDLSRAAYDLRHELDNAVLEFKGARDRLVQMVGEGIGSVVDQATAPLHTFRARTEELLQTVTGTFGEFTQNAERVRTATARVATATEALGTRIDAVAVPADLLERKVDATLTGFATALQAHCARLQEGWGLESRFQEHLTAALTALAAVQEAIRPVRTDLERATNALAGFDAVAPSVAALAASADGARANLAIFNQALERHSGLVAGLALDAESQTDLVKTQRTLLAAELDRLRADLQSVSTAHQALRAGIESHAHAVTTVSTQQTAVSTGLGNVTEALHALQGAVTHATAAATTLTAGVDGLHVAAGRLPELGTAFATAHAQVAALNESLAGHAAAITRCVAGIGGDEDVIRQHRRAIEQELESSRRAVSEVFDTLARLARVIVEQLDEHRPG